MEANALREPSVIKLNSLTDVSKKMGFLLPKDLSTVKNAVGTQAPSAVRQLTLEIQLRKSQVFSVTQFSPPIDIATLPPHFIRDKRISDGLTVLLVTDPGTKNTTTEYVRHGISFSVRGSHFADRDLEAYISSFRSIE